MLLPRRANLYLLRIGVGGCAIALVGLWASFIALIATDLSGTAFRFALGFGAVSTLLLAGSKSVRMAYLESIQRFREARDDFENRMR